MITTMVLLAAVGLTAASGAPRADGAMARVLSGDEFPLTMKLSSCTGRWRCVTVRWPVSTGGNLAVNVSGNSSVSNSQADVGGLDLLAVGKYLTLGQTVRIGDVTYLVAYRLASAALDGSHLLQALALKKAPDLAPLTAETEMALCLLSLRGAGSLENVRAFDMAREIAESEKTVEAARAMLSALTQGGSNQGSEAESHK